MMRYLRWGYLTILLQWIHLCAEPLHLVWQVDRERIWETDWILELLSGYEIEEIIDGHFEEMRDQSLVVICGDPGDYFNQMREMNYRFGVIHLSDETYSHPTEFYPLADFVLRNYWHKKFLDQKNVSFIALGYKNGFWRGSSRPSIHDAIDRHYDWSFAGQIGSHSTRGVMVSSMKQIPNYYIHEIFTWNDSTSLSPTAYRDLMLDSIFIPCSRGYFNLDSFRVYEALECGCIPIVEKTPFDYFQSLFGDHPFIAVDSWEEAPELVDELLDDWDRLEERRQACYQWWLDYKKQARNQIRALIQNHLDI